mmetsp:Transcript_93/g.326  ORF Transcript_93/g.326 Transcript_93/m.326 type:complete len:320 (-) Transcript_93:409-1368(-)
MARRRRPCHQHRHRRGGLLDADLRRGHRGGGGRAEVLLVLRVPVLGLGGDFLLQRARNRQLPRGGRVQPAPLGLLRGPPDHRQPRRARSCGLPPPRARRRRRGSARRSLRSRGGARRCRERRGRLVARAPLRQPRGQDHARAACARRWRPLASEGGLARACARARPHVAGRARCPCRPACELGLARRGRRQLGDACARPGPLRLLLCVRHHRHGRGAPPDPARHALRRRQPHHPLACQRHGLRQPALLPVLPRRLWLPHRKVRPGLRPRARGVRALRRQQLCRMRALHRIQPLLRHRLLLRRRLLRRRGHRGGNDARNC